MHTTTRLFTPFVGLLFVEKEKFIYFFLSQQTEKRAGEK
jgi:hypothetical protein